METYIPDNEPGTVHLFSKYHEQLGFEKILVVQSAFPDITAVRNGEVVKIEMEYILSRFNIHYKAIKRRYWASEFKWNEIKGHWSIYDSRDDSFPLMENMSLINNNPMLRNKDDFLVSNMGDLCYKSIKHLCDCVICWRADTVLREDIEVIELEKELSEYFV